MACSELQAGPRCSSSPMRLSSAAEHARSTARHPDTDMTGPASICDGADAGSLGMSGEESRA